MKTELKPTEAQEIGALFQRAGTSYLDSFKLLIECGKRLREQQRVVAHGQWLSWLEKNRNVLGFGSQTASRLINMAGVSTKNLTESKALALSRQIWGHTKKISAPKSNMSPATDLDETAHESKDLEKSTGSIVDAPEPETSAPETQTPAPKPTVNPSPLKTTSPPPIPKL